MGTIIIVEGKSDTRRLKEIYPDVQTFETSGLGLDDDKIAKLIELSKYHKLIVFTDPDGPGEIIRKRLIENIDNLGHAYLPNDKAISKNKLHVGIEHGSDQEIKIALDNIYHISENTMNYSLEDMYSLGLYNDRIKRKEFCDFLHIAYGNNKKVVKQLNSFNIEPKVVAEAIRRINGTS